MPIKSGLVKFNDGEGLSHTDLNTLQQRVISHYTDRHVFENLYQLAVERQGETTAIPFTVADFGSGQPYAYVNSTEHTKYTLAFGVVAATPVVTSGLNWELLPGTVGQIAATGAPTFQDVAARIYSISNGEFTGALASNSGGSGDRLDGLFIKIDPVDDTSTTVDFKDATTGALTTTSFNKRTAYTATVTAVTGTPSSINVPAAPGAGYTPIAYFRVTTANAVTAYDVLMPAGGTWDCRAPRHGAGASTVAIAMLNGVKVVTSGDDVYIFPTAPSRYARLLQAHVFIDGPASSNVSELSLGRVLTGSAMTAVHNYTSMLSSGTQQTVNLQYMPELIGQIDLTNPDKQPPFWGSGFPSRYDANLSSQIPVFKVVTSQNNVTISIKTTWSASL